MKIAFKVFYLFVLFSFSEISKAQEIKCNSIVWKAQELGEVNLKKGALMLPVKAGDKTFLLQLDLGRADSYIYKSELDKIPTNYFSINGDEITINGKISKLNLAHTFKLYDNKGDTVNSSGSESDPKLIGVIGLNFFLDKKLYIDFINDQFEIIESKQNFDFTINNAITIPFKLKNKKLLIKTTIDDKEFWFFYDTGSSYFPMITNKNNWQLFTHNDSVNKTCTTIKIPSKNNNVSREVVFLADTIRDNILLGDINFKNKLVYFESNDSFNFSAISPELTGVIGNAIFFDKYKIIIDFDKQTFLVIDK
jgi:hypothetical protein